MPLANPISLPRSREPWNKGRLLGQKRPLKPKDLWTIRVRLQQEGRKRDLAMFNLTLDSKLGGCNLVQLKIDDVSAGGRVGDRATVIQTRGADRFSSNSPSKPEALSETGCPVSVSQRVSTCFRAVSGSSRTCCPTPFRAALVAITAADQGATRRMPTSVSTAASKRRRARSGARDAITLPSAIPGNEPISSEASRETSTVPTAR
jgi:hypothetical protein